MNRLQEYINYHKNSARIGDIDPSYSMLKYVCNRFELNLEQRFWLAFLYACTYCGATTFYIYNEFPDYENVDAGRMVRWWHSRGRDASIFQTDRRWCRSRDQFPDVVESYREWIGEGTQEEAFAMMAIGDTPEQRYDRVYDHAKRLFTFGQFTLFLYLEALHTISPLDLCPTDLDLNVAWSCRNGLYYAYGLDHFIYDTQTPTPIEAYEITAEKWRELREILARLEAPPTVWQTETILCAYRKWHRGKRWIGYYLDRQSNEISNMESRVSEGVAWRVLWEYREETYKLKDLREKFFWVDDKAWKGTRILETERMVQ